MFSAIRITCVSLLVGLAGALWYSQSIAIDENADRAYRLELRAQQVSDASLSNDLLVSRAGIVTHYDDLVRRIVTLREQAKVLSRPPSFVSRSSGRADIEEAVALYEETLDKQEVLIENFKFNHAVLRNSLRYFPGETLALAERVAAYPEGQELSTTLAGLYSSVLLHYLFSQQSRPLKEQIAALVQETPSWLSAQDQSSLALLAEHAQIIVKHKPLVDNAIAGLLALPSATNVHGISEVYARNYTSAANEAERAVRLVWFLALAFVVAASAYIILRLRRSARALAAATNELEEAVASLGLEKERQKELAELKSRFVSMTSHEFRTPLSVVLSSAELLQAYGERWSEEKKQTHLIRVQDAATYMKQMLDEVLLIGRAEAGKLSSNAESIDVALFCEDLLESLRLQAGDAHSVSYTKQGQLNDIVLDRQLLMHILDNLLSNAFKYSGPEQEVHFDVTRETATLVFTVADTGIGISEEDQKELFESFHRGDNVGDVAGTGLGLAVVKKSLDVLRGEIAVQSSLGVGSTFTVRIPVEETPSEQLRDSA